MAKCPLLATTPGNPVSSPSDLVQLLYYSLLPCVPCPGASGRPQKDAWDLRHGDTTTAETVEQVLLQTLCDAGNPVHILRLHAVNR